MHSNENRIIRIYIAFYQCDLFFPIDQAPIQMKTKLTMFCREIYISNFFNEFFILQTVPDYILNSSYLDLIF